MADKVITTGKFTVLPRETMPRYIHTCTHNSGPKAGMEHTEPVSYWEVEAQRTCRVCGDPLATPAQIAAHIYQHLTGD